jgi:steroid delta-isomerase-like uncharacterized protein
MGISRQDAIALVHRIADAANTHDIPALMELYAEDAVVISPAMSRITGRAAIGAAWDLMLSTFPDWKVCPDEVLVDGDRIIALGVNTATDRKGWFGLPPTGSTIKYRAVLLLTIADGKIVHEERVYDVSSVRQLLEKARIDRELTTAAEIQRVLLSRTARIGSHYEALGDSLPCRTIGGDFFEFIELPSGALATALGDVAGKGPPAALLAAMLQGMITAEARAAESPSGLMNSLNRALVDRGLGSQFATLAYGVLFPDGRFSYCNAGHNAPLVASGGQIRRLTTGGPILGVFRDAAFEEETLALSEQDLVVMFSDGVTEACNPQGEEFGEERLISAVSSYGALPGREFLAAILGNVSRFCHDAQQTDDITVTATRFSKRR